MKIMFLDIDGVVNVIPEKFDDYGAVWHAHFIDNLAHLIKETGAKIVLSAGKRAMGLLEVKNMWKFRNLPGEVIDVTPLDVQLVNQGLFHDIEDVCRGHEIQYWLDHNPFKHEVENYVILDDDEDMLPSQMNNFVRTSGNKHHGDCVDNGYGLTQVCTQQAILILNR